MPSEKLQKFGNPSRADAGVGNRAIKLLKPICTPESVETKGFDRAEACQLPENIHYQWWEDCPHEPYITRVEMTRKLPIMGEPNEKGEREVTGYKETRSYKDRPNIVQAHQMPNITSGQEAQVFIDQGCKLPQELGIAPFCEYEECYSQNLKVNLTVPDDEGNPQSAGAYCSKRQAQLVKARLTGKFLEVYNAEVRARQLAELAV